MDEVGDRLFRLMVDRVQDYAIFVLDRDGHIRSWNAGAALIKGYSADEIIGRHFSTFYTPDDIARHWPEHELKLATTEGRFEDSGWRVRKDGTRFWANVIITALRDEKGQLLGFSKITRDLTELKREAEELRESEERFRLLVEGVQDYAIYMLSPDGVVTSWNLGARRIKGYAASEIIGKHFSRFYEKGDIEAGRPWNELAIAREHGRAEDEGWRLRKDGTRFWARVVVTALHDAGGELRGFAKVTQDLTQRRNAEATEDAARRVNDFIAVLALELRNPLAPFRNSVRILETVGSDPAALEKVRGIIDRQSGQLARIVDDLLDINRISRGALVVTRRPLELRDVVSRAVEAARPGIESAGHALELRIPEGDYRVEGDDVRLAQALTNILNNAARYTDPGGRISLSMARAGSEEAPMLEVSVRDSGRGIEPQMLGSIFGMFFQGRAAIDRPHAGLGVGLALARTIVELHHGTIEARSEGPGKGSEFVLRLPASHAATAAAPEPPAKSRAPEPAVKSRRILVVDDNVDAATSLSTLLRLLGHEVLTVHGGVEALQASEGFRPEVVMLDIGMPGMTGYEVARRLRERRRSPEPLIVAVTGWGKAEDVQRGRDAGFDLHLVKPVESASLAKVFERALERARRA